MKEKTLRAIEEEVRRLAELAAQGAACLLRLADHVASLERSPPAEPPVEADPQVKTYPALPRPAPAPPEPAAPTPAPAPAAAEPAAPAPPPPPPPRPSAPKQVLQGIPAEIRGLEEEIDLTESYLASWGRRAKNAQIAVWAGMARDIQDRVGAGNEPTQHEDRDRLRWVFGRLTRIVREKEAGWVDALTEQWATDWKSYVAFHAAIVRGSAPDLPIEVERKGPRDLLRGLFLPHRRVSINEAHTAILEASTVLAADDDVLSKALQIFGDPAHAVPRQSTRKKLRRDTEILSPRPSHEIPAEVLAVTRGKRVLMAGGQGAREEQRRALEQAFEFGELDWVYTERDQASPFGRLAERIRGGRYDLVIYLAAYASHKASSIVQASKDSSVPIVYLSRGYGIAALVQAVQEQIVGAA